LHSIWRTGQHHSHLLMARSPPEDARLQIDARLSCPTSVIVCSTSHLSSRLWMRT
jgi:hypothetical protein